jgi:esterase/lipase
MRRLGRLFLVLLACLFAMFLALWVILPADIVDREITFDGSVLTDDLDLKLLQSEQQFSDIVPGAVKRIQWAGEKGAKTPIAVVYVHGFSATAEEIRPVPDEVAKALGANLFFTRLAGHGRTGAALAAVSAGDWVEDTAEAMATGRRLGDRVLLIGTSTGATLAALAATDPLLSEDLAGVVLVSPNFGLHSAAAVLLDTPLVRYWGWLVAGKEMGFTPMNADHGRFWTTKYPTQALFPMAALVRHVRALDFGQAKAPALVVYAPTDQVIDVARIGPIMAMWGGDVRLERREMGAGDDPFAHVIAGDILSPGQTEAVTTLILDWAEGL